MKFSPLIKGVITAIGMIGFNLFAYYNISVQSPLHFLVFAIYAIGIIWTIVDYRNSPDNIGKFGDGFNTGFKCFIVATLLMVVYTFIFNKMNPQFAEESALLYKQQLLSEKDNSKTPIEIDEATARYKNGYTMAVVYGSIFGYLIVGAAVTALGSLITIRRK